MNNKHRIIVDINHAGSRLDKFLAKNGFGFSLSQKLLRQKDVKVNSVKAGADYKLEHEDVVEIFGKYNFTDNVKSKPKISEEKLNLIKKSIIYQGDNLLIIDKPEGIAVQSGDPKDFSIDAALSYLKLDREENPRLVHRLDRDTSGILLLARNRQSSTLLTEGFKNKTIKKTYLALVKGIPEKSEGRIEIPLEEKSFGDYKKVFKSDLKNPGAKEAITLYKILEDFGEYSLLQIELITGRMHQIRVHLKEIGHPVIGDRKYGNNLRSSREMGFKRLCLHSYKIEIDDFFGKKLVIKTDKPDFL